MSYSHLLTRRSYKVEFSNDLKAQKKDIKLMAHMLSESHVSSPEGLEGEGDNPKG